MNIPNIKVMEDRLAEVIAEIRMIDAKAGDRRLAADEEARYNDLNVEAAEIESNIEGAREQEKRAAQLAETRRRWGSVQVSSDDRTSWASDAAARMTSGEARDAALTLLERSAPHLNSAQRDHVDKLIRRESTPEVDSTDFNRHIVATSSPDYVSAFRKLTGPSMSSIVTLSDREAAAVGVVQRSSMAEGSGATGGYMVPAFLDPTIALNAQGSANPIRQLARNETITTSRWKGVGTSGVSWTFVPEGTASADASPTVDQPAIDLHTARAWLTYSIELQQDAVELDRQLFNLLAAGWDDTVAGVLATGSGSGAPKGVITALAAVPASVVTIATPGTLSPADVSAAWVGLPDRARGGASWVMNESVREAIAAWGDEFGNRSVDLGARLNTLRERPVYSSEKFPELATTTASANQMVVGDFSGYLIAQRAGMTVEPVQTVVDGNGFPVGKRGLFAWARIGADVIDPGLLRLLKQ